MLSNDADNNEGPEQSINYHVDNDVVAAKIQTILPPWSLNHYVMGIGGFNLWIQQTAQVSIESVDREEQGEEDHLVSEVGDWEAIDLEPEANAAPISVVLLAVLYEEQSDDTQRDAKAHSRDQDADSPS